MKLLIKVIGVIIMGLSFFSVMACSVDTGVTSKVESLLNEKYGEEFKSVKIGNRLNTGTTTLYCCNINSEERLFEVVYNLDNADINDNYIKTMLNYDFADEFEAEMAKYDVDVACTVTSKSDDSSAETNVDMSLDEYIQKYNVKRLFVRAAVDETQINEQWCEDFIKGVIDLNNKYNTKINVIVFPMESGKFNECQKDVIAEVEPGNDWYLDYSDTKTEFVVNTENGQVNTTVTELLEGLKGE